jgi:hypothetical protein
MVIWSGDSRTAFEAGRLLDMKLVMTLLVRDEADIVSSNKQTPSVSRRYAG